MKIESVYHPLQLHRTRTNQHQNVTLDLLQVQRRQHLTQEPGIKQAVFQVRHPDIKYK